MMFFKSTFVLSALLALTSAVSIDARTEKSILSDPNIHVHGFKAPAFALDKSSCDAEDEADCKEFCGLSEQTATCSANGNKITCSCKGGKSESNCEERCLLCMPGKSAMEEARRLFKLGGSKVDEL